MSITKTLVNKLLITLAVILGVAAFSAPVYATTVSSEGGGVSQQPSPAVSSSTYCQKTDSAAKLNNCLNHSKIVQDLQTIVNILAAGIGVIVVGMIILGGIQYSIAGDNASAVSAAKQRIINALIALIAFIFMYSFVNWLIPGGVFG